MKGKWRKAIFLTIIAAGLKIFSLFPNAVEHYYSNGLYPAVSHVQRMLLGWIPFSVGDLLYAAAVIYLLYETIHLIKNIVKKKADPQYFGRALRRFVVGALLVYVTFNLLWGLNYNRLGIARQTGLTVEKYSKQDLYQVMQQLVYRLNAYDSSARLNRISLQKKKTLFDGAVIAYEMLSDSAIQFRYRNRSVKPSLYSYLGNYLGFTGYYNPFSGEAQVNTTVPVFILPFTTCHEIGHQLGYAKESEANFAGFLSGKASTNPAFAYSVYFDMYSYARVYLYNADSTKLREFDAQLQPGVRNDYKELRKFIQSYANPVEVIIDRLYSTFLRANEQPSGRLSYNEVIAMVIAYYKRHGGV